MRSKLHPRLIVVYVVGVMAMVAVACGADTSSNSGGSTNPPLTDKQKRAKKQVKAQKTLSFSGNGLKNLGTIKITSESLLRWTNDGDLMTVTTDSDPIVLVNSQGASGDTVVNKGTYKNVQVNALGNWTIKVKDR